MPYFEGPMFKSNLIPRFNVDYSFSDFSVAVKSVFFKGNQDKTILRGLLRKSTPYFTNSGRTAIYVVIRALKLVPGSNVGVPLFTCSSVIDAILEAGHTPRFIDINFENLTLDLGDLKNKKQGLDALIVIHTFGRPAHMDEILSIAGNIPVIEDCAHSLLSRYKEKLTGTIGDASIFSFRSGKYISAGEGGMVVVNNGGLEEKVKIEADMLSKPRRLNELKHVWFVYVKSLLYHRPWYGLFARAVGARLDSKMNISGKQGFKAERIRKSDIAVFLNKLLVFERLVETQRKNSFILLEELKDSEMLIPRETEDTYCNYYLFPVLFKTEDTRDRAHADLAKAGVDTAKLFSETPNIAQNRYGYKGDCPNTEQIAKRVLTIPNYYTLSEDEIRMVAEKVREVS
jgi:dTDP-4-amino-4,6-dideoxygalactose transaminase